MDKVSSTISRWWPSTATYEPVDAVDDEAEIYDAEEADDALKRKAPEFSFLEYLVFALLGMAMLWSW